jgi:lysophospholipase L1-like esterase
LEQGKKVFVHVKIKLDMGKIHVYAIVLGILGAFIWSLVGCSQSLDDGFGSAPAATGPILYAWGNSQTQGFGLSGCDTLTCHPATAWPQFFADAMGLTLNNQAYGSSDCADLTYKGTSLSLWDLVIDGTSRNIYSHFRNDQAAYGPLPYRVNYARDCIEAQTAWLAVPESQKVRANSNKAMDTGAWVNMAQNPVGSVSLTGGATKTFVVSGITIYLATARMIGGGTTHYTVSVDGNFVDDPSSRSTTFDQNMDISGSTGFPMNEKIIQNFIRVSGLNDSQHSVVYTCVAPSVVGCYVFYAAGIKADSARADAPVVYSLSPIYNSFKGRVGYMNDSTTLLYRNEWAQMVSELYGDGLQVIGLDATDLRVYNPTTESQADGVHPSVIGQSDIAAAFVAKAKEISK